MELILKKSLEEKDFIHACICKETWALKKLYEDHYSMMYPMCMRYANNNDDALDILHDGFIKVFNNLEKYQVGTSLIAWIKRIMVNTAIDYYRKETRRRTTDLDHVLDITNDEPDVISAMTAEELLEALQKLSPAYRSVFNMYVIEGYSHRELAEQLGITESTSRSNLVKARHKLKEIITARMEFSIKNAD
ncbi:MAG: RNA polymerase sigma factor [Saprospiraceae bacterium]|nr:RNA polymerase sigma factor [Saprospiraceae bacterium]MBK8635088.1 RNA polymerase sigma factor [Saprospiraceae bacterium]MBP7643613.1 RNA polymerase sigma factor [Saprospiraceae bacterium]